MAHGADYHSFANVTDATLVEGHAPETTEEAVIGTDLAQTLDVAVGDTLTVGGSVSPGVRQYEIVGTYRARGTLDDLLVIPLESAWGLATREGQVHMIRVAGDVPTGATEGPQTANQTGLAVTELTGPATVTKGENVTLAVTLTGSASISVGGAPSAPPAAPGSASPACSSPGEGPCSAPVDRSESAASPDSLASSVSGADESSVSMLSLIQTLLTVVSKGCLLIYFLPQNRS